MAAIGRNVQFFPLLINTIIIHIFVVVFFTEFTSPYRSDYRPTILIETPFKKNCVIVKTTTAAKNVTFNLQDGQQLAERKFAAVTMEGRAAVCRHVRAVGKEYLSREHGMDSVMGRIIITPMMMMMMTMICQNLQLVVTKIMIYKELVQSSLTTSEVK